MSYQSQPPGGNPQIVAPLSCQKYLIPNFFIYSIKINFNIFSEKILNLIWKHSKILKWDRNVALLWPVREVQAMRRSHSVFSSNSFFQAGMMCL